jgi:hypothetical protein
MSLATSIKRRRVLMSSAFAAVAILIWLLWPAPKEPPAPPLPSPNGYDDFVKAGKLLDPTPPDYSRMPLEELRAYIGTNQEPLRFVRLGLTRECWKPIEYSKTYYDQHWNELSDMKKLAQLISAEGRLGQAEGRYGDAARAHLGNVSFGQLSSNGGLIIEKLVGLAIEAVGIVGLERVADRLTARETRTVIEALQASDSRSKAPAEFVARDRLWSKRVYTLGDRIRGIWQYRTLRPDRAADAKFAEKIHKIDRHRRQLMLNLAARAYELEHGKRPVRAEDLVPSVLRAVPKDPETGTNLVLNTSP